MISRFNGYYRSTGCTNDLVRSKSSCGIARPHLSLANRTGSEPESANSHPFSRRFFAVISLPLISSQIWRPQKIGLMVRNNCRSLFGRSTNGYQNIDDPKSQKDGSPYMEPPQEERDAVSLQPMSDGSHAKDAVLTGCGRIRSPKRWPRRRRWRRPWNHFTSSNSPGFQVLSNHDWPGP
jgi:hypothetical protein